MTKRKSILLSDLMRRVRAATSEKGARKALATKLGITPQAMNDWLSERFAPGGEVTLILLEWVQAEEVKQQKQNRAGACNTSAAVAQPRKLDEKKPKSGRKGR